MLGLWLATAAGAQAALVRIRKSQDVERELAGRRRLQPFFAVEHLAFAAAVFSGLALMRALGWDFDHARWLGLKVGLVAFLLLPLESLHAYACHVWIARGLRQTVAPPISKDLSRGIGMEEMVVALAIPLLALALPLLLWLSWARP